jgi:hypothetical protein
MMKGGCVKRYIGSPAKPCVWDKQKKVMTMPSVSYGDNFNKSSGRLHQIIGKTRKNHREDFFYLLPLLTHILYTYLYTPPFYVSFFTIFQLSACL